MAAGIRVIRNMNVTIRRSAGNADCWTAVCGPNDFLMATSYRLDALILLVLERHGRQKIRLARHGERRDG